MPSIPSLAVSIAALCAAAAGCGARSGLFDDEPADAGPRLDATRPPDPETCVAGAPFEVLRTTGPLLHPRLARSGGNALLVATRAPPDGVPELVAMPIDLHGRARGAIQPIADGSGGTLIGRTLDGSTPGFTLSFRDAAGVLAGARMDLDGRLLLSGTLDVESPTDRPLLVITPELVANGWSVAGSVTAQGFVQDVRSGETTPLVFDGTEPHAAPATDPGRFHAISHFGGRTVLATLDRHGEGPPAREIRLEDFTDTPFPVQAQLTRIAEGHDGAFLIGGGTVRAIYDAIVHLELGAERLTSFLPNDFLFDADVAFDPPTRWLGAAAGVLHDEGIAPPTPHVFFFALDATGRTAELVLASGLPAAEAHPAILATGLADAEFLVVWEASADTLDAVLVDCGSD